jgi:hypothetical protein
METKMTVVSSRDVAPQWGGGKGLNLGEFTVNAVEFSGAGLVALVSESELMANAMADLVNGQLHIRFGSKLCSGRVEAEMLPRGQRWKLDEDGEREVADDGSFVIEKFDEKPEAFFTRTRAAARDIAKVVLKDFSPDYVEAFKAWAKDDFAKRGTRTDKRPVLADYDKVVGQFEAHWDKLNEPRRVNGLAKLGLDVELAKGGVDAVVKAIEAKYQRPVSVAADDLFTEEE